MGRLSGDGSGGQPLSSGGGRLSRIGTTTQATPNSTLQEYQKFRVQQDAAPSSGRIADKKVQEIKRRFETELKTSSQRARARRTFEQIASDPNNPESATAKELLRQLPKSVGDNIGDFTAASNEALFGGFQRGLVGAANYVGSGFNPEEGARRTEEFLRTTGQTNQRGESRLARGSDREGGAFQAGRITGEVQKTAAEIAGLVIPAVGTSRLLQGTRAIQGLRAGNLGQRTAGVVLPELAGGAVATGISQFQNPEQNFAQSAAIGAGVDVAASLLPGAIGAGVRGIKKASANRKAGAAEKAVETLSELQRNNELTTANKYKQGRLQKSLQAVKEAANQTTELRKIDTDYAKSLGLKRVDDLPPTERLELIFDKGLSASRQVNQLLKTPTSTGQSAYKLIKKYGEASDKGKNALKGAGADFNRYSNNKFDLDYRTRNGRPIQKDIADDDLAKAVADYEAKNPDALADVATKKALNDQAVDLMADAGVFSRAEADLIKNSSEFAVPLERLISDDLERVIMGGRSAGSLGRQSVVQALEGGSDIPLSSSFAPLIRRIEKAVKQSNINILAAKTRERGQQGLVKNFKELVDPANVKARRELGEVAQELTKDANKLQREVKVDKRQLTRLERELNALNKTGKDRAIKTAGNDITTKTPTGRTPATQTVFKSIIKASDSELTRIKNKIGTREPKLAAKLDELMDAKKNLAETKEVRRGVRQTIIEFGDETSTGKNTISGFENGEKFKLEVSPDLYRVLQGSDFVKQNIGVEAFGAVTKVFRTAWTGFINPIFTGISTVFYDLPMSAILPAINNPSAFAKTLAPKAFAESFKSLNSNSAFQRVLARGGAQLQGGSQLAQNAAISAQDIASRSSLGKRLLFLTKNPTRALEAADQLTGKLSNITRTRIAKGYFDDAVKQGMSEKDAIGQAVWAYNNILPNYARANQAVKSIDKVLPYFSASIAGTRSLLTTVKSSPGRSVAALAVVSGPMLGVTAYNYSSQEGQDFYKDMADSGRLDQLDNNLIVVMPGASKNPDTGEWTGILKVPIPPEFRALNKVARESVTNFVTGTGQSVGSTATAVFDFVTGGVRTVENPLVDTVRTVSGVNPQSDLFDSKPLVQGNMANLPKGDQVFENTSEAAKFLSNITGKNISPIQADAILGQFGYVGQLTKGRTTEDQLKNRFQKAYGQTTGSRYYEQYALVNALKSQASKKVTADIKADNIDSAQAKAEEFNKKVDEAALKYSRTYGADSDLLTELNNLKINLTDRSIKSRRSQE